MEPKNLYMFIGKQGQMPYQTDRRKLVNSKTPITTVVASVARTTRTDINTNAAREERMAFFTGLDAILTKIIHRTLRIS